MRSISIYGQAFRFNHFLALLIFHVKTLNSFIGLADFDIEGKALCIPSKVAEDAGTFPLN
jgi:hypothetical protein